MTINASSGPGAGAAVDLQLSHADTTVLAAASADLAETLREYSELADIENSYAAGKPQLDLALTPAGRTLGLSSSDIARQLRGAFYGSEALREQRGRNEMKVMVRLPEEQRGSESDLENLMIRTPGGAFAPLREVAEVTRNRAPTEIVREDGRRTVNVKAELAPGVKSNQEVLKSVTTTDVPALQARYPGLAVEMVGQQRSQAESFASLGQNYIVALFLIYALLAIPFRSYTQPFIIMSAIPFGFVGAVCGHLVMGFELSIISIMGIIALSGVVVNDSLVLIDAANRARTEGHSAWAAIIHAGTRRFRPILLTSLTTFFGLMPMIFETSMQARFLIPMAISLGFGVLFATVIALLIVPALYLIVEDGLDSSDEQPARANRGRGRRAGRGPGSRTLTNGPFTSRPPSSTVRRCGQASNAGIDCLPSAHASGTGEHGTLGEMMQVTVGESIVVPGCGVGTVEAVESMDLSGSGTPEQLYKITFEDGDQRKMWVPVDRVAEQNLRPVMSAELVEQTWEVIRSQEAPDARATWNRRQRRYSEMLMSNSPRALAELLGELAAVRSEKPLSFTEKRMFRQVWDLLVGEISASTGDSREVVEERMEKVVPPAAA